MPNDGHNNSWKTHLMLLTKEIQIVRIKPVASVFEN